MAHTWQWTMAVGPEPPHGEIGANPTSRGPWPRSRLVKVALLGLSITLKRGKISVAEIHLGRDPIL